MRDDDAEAAVADAWASIDGKLEEFRAEKAMAADDPRRVASGCYDGYLHEAGELVRRLRQRGYSVVRTRFLRIVE